MAIDIGPKIGLDGEKEFRTQLNQVNTAIKTLSTEMKKVSSEFQENENSQEALRQKNEVLNKTIDEQRKKLEMVQRALRESTEKYGETSTKTQQWQQVVNRTETALNDLQAELKQNEQALQEMDEGLRDVETGLQKVDKAAENTEDIGENFKEAAENGVMILSGALTGLAAAFTGAAESSREYRTDQGKLQVAFEEAGFSAGQAKDAFVEIYSILGEDDTSVEAANHLAELTNNQKELAAWTGDILPGVFAKFGDSLPLEGLTEAANETAKVGTVTGTLADALNWAGVNEDQFNESLAKCSSEQERQQLITETLTELYGDASRAYKETNAEVIEANKAQANLTDSIARLGEVAEPTISRLKNILADLIDVIADAVDGFNDLPESTQNVILAISGIGIAAGPTIKGVTSVTNGISKLGKGLRAFFSPAKTAATAVSGVGTAAVGATAGVTGISAAFKGFTAVLSANPIILVTTALAALATGIGIYVKNTIEANTETGKLKAELEAAQAEMEEYTSTMDSLKEQRDETLSDNASEFTYYESLKKELDEIVDKNGKVSDGYEGRAQLITNELSEALGIEIEMNDGVIKSYDKLSDSIDKTMEKKKAEAYISAGEEGYQEAIRSEQELIENLSVARKNLEAAEKEYQEAKEKGSLHSIETSRKERDEMQKIYDDYMKQYLENNEIIEDQETAMQEFLEGNYEAVYQDAFGTQKAISEMTKSETNARIKEVQETEAIYRDLYKQTGDETYKIMADNNAKEIEQLEEHLTDLAAVAESDNTFVNSIRELANKGYSAFNSIPWSNAGNEIINGVNEGMRKQAQKLRDTAAYVSGQVLNAFYGALDINSPSKLMRDKVGVQITAGIAAGEEKGIPLIKKANEAIVKEVANMKMPSVNLRGVSGTAGDISPTPMMSSEERAINLTVYSVLDGQIISKTVQKDISKSQSGIMRAKGVVIG